MSQEKNLSESSKEIPPETEPKKKRKSSATRRKTRTAKQSNLKQAKQSKSAAIARNAKYPRHALGKVLRIPRAILDQNAGQACSEKEAAAFVGVGFGGPFKVEVSSALKYGLLERPESGKIGITDRARKILRPQSASDELAALREAVIDAPDVSDVYRHYRGENLPDSQFFSNALIEKFKIPEDKVLEFESIFLETLSDAKLIEDNNGKHRLLDASQEGGTAASAKELKKLGKAASVKSTDTCFVMMPFGVPIGGYYELIYEPAIKKAGLTPIRADADIFGTGKIIDQIWRGVNSAKILVAELTGKNPNVFYELGLAHALNKPVVLISSNESDVPFDLQHIRVVYYDIYDPFWGNKLIDKIAENVLSAINNPEEAIFSSALERVPDDAR